MAYTTPITDRDTADILAQNSKAFLNVSDWTRIYNNAVAVHDLFTALTIWITFNTLALPTTVTVPKKTTFLNLLLANIERMRLWVATNAPGEITDSSFVEIKDDWDEGFLAAAPNFTHVNSWEQVLDLMHVEVQTWSNNRYARCGVAPCGAGLTRQNSWRG